MKILYHHRTKSRDGQYIHIRSLIDAFHKAGHEVEETGLTAARSGNVHDETGGSTYCHQCGEKLIGRDWYQMTEWNLTAGGRCRFCGAPCPGVFEEQPGDWGAQRAHVRIR